MSKKLNFQFDGEGSLNLVWIHGFGGNLRIWDRTIPEFQNYRNLRVDYYGHGESSKDIPPEAAPFETIASIENWYGKNWTARSYGLDTVLLVT